jgi:hypothetical protein
MSINIHSTSGSLQQKLPEFMVTFIKIVTLDRQKYCFNPEDCKSIPIAIGIHGNAHG